ncbi:pirin family protein [Streptomyces roseicoloratus]|uniref:Pirin family protein n=1 Tax=Streptomyces roseicoloratus TaxID=2508722 RepID=A0ABY9RZN4_9ACTN|nr:pirin family protein [Streptomyces roseicoloratus]WMX47239.1 pirin family protein [Streptomyces roseicoloratus]
MIRIQRGGDRYPGGDPETGIDTRHAFSFGRYYDPDNLRFGALLACNEERLAASAGFDEHPHRHTEIVTWVVEGELTHRDSTGHATVVRPGDLQHLSAAAGVRHVERNDGPGPLVFVQMWLAPLTAGGEPSYDVVRGIAGATPYAVPAAGAVLHVHRLERDARVAVPEADFVYVHVVRGTVRLSGEELGAGDAARASEEKGLALLATADAEVLVWEMRGGFPDGA